MKLQKTGIEDLAAKIRQRAVEIASDEGHDTDIPVPAITRLRETIEFGRHWVLSDYQSAHGLGAIKIAAAELSVQFDVTEE